MKTVSEGAPFGHEILFEPAAPTGAIDYTLRGNDNTVLLTSSVIPPTGAVSAVIVVPPSYATLSGGRLFENRILSWGYDGVSGSTRYRVNGFLPFAVSPEGVRNKLGVLDELPDEDIDLVAAYIRFTTPLVDQAALTTAATASSLVTLQIIDAIEATAALELLPTLQIKLAKERSGGTNSFKRDTVDWEMLRASLQGLVADGAAVIDIPTSTGAGFIFALSTRVDPITNA